MSKTKLAQKKAAQALYYEYRLMKIIEGGRLKTSAEAAEAFWNEFIVCNSTPLIVGNRAYFLYHGDAEKVAVAGDWSRWQPNLELSRIGRTKLFYVMKEFPETARLQYKIIIDGSWQVDIHNSALSEEGFGVNSELIMPLSPDKSYLSLKNFPEKRRGRIESHSIESKHLGSARNVFLYIPTLERLFYDKLPLAIFHDGGEALSIGKFHHILDHLIYAKKLRPCAAVFIAPDLPNRNKEYTDDEPYIRFCIEELIPFAVKKFIDHKILVSEVPQERCIIGASLGGLLATKMSLEHPAVLGSCIAQSPAYWWNRRSIFRSLHLKNAAQLRVILQTGTISDARENTLLMYGTLRDQGASVEYQEFAQGHTWGNWRTNLAQALLAWLPENTVPKQETV